MRFVKDWQNRPLEGQYAIMYLDCIHVKLKREHKIQSVPIYVCLGVDLEGKKDILGHWVGTGSEAANYWLSVISELQQRGVKDILIAAVDGLTGFADAIQSIYPDTIVQRCIVHQIRNALKYVSWKHKKAFVADMKTVYKAPTKEAAGEANIR
jgi:putative transposase